MYVRIKEYLAGKRRCNISTPLGRHMVEEHNGDDYYIKYEFGVRYRDFLWKSSRSSGFLREVDFNIYTLLTGQDGD